MAKPALGLDFDDVIMDFNTGLALWHNKHHGTNYARDDVLSYHLGELWNVPLDEQNRRILLFYHSPEHAGARPVSGASLIIPRLVERYEIFVVSARPEHVRRVTTAWLTEHFPSLVPNLHLTNRFGAGGELQKSAICKRLGIEIFVDDSPSHHEDLARIMPRAILFETPWNRTYASQLPLKQKVRSWQELHLVLTGK